MDDRQFFLDLMDEANFANVSFYPIDPRGLPAFDNPIGPEAPPPINVDQAMLKQRIEIMRTMAENTDGIAVVNSNDLDRGMKRISDDLTSYYLLGYYSTNSKLDGRFRSLKVKVKQPGVDVRARRGYRAATDSRSHQCAARGGCARSRGDHAPSPAPWTAWAAFGRTRGLRHQRGRRAPASSRRCGLPASCSQPPGGQTSLLRAALRTSRRAPAVVENDRASRSSRASARF